MKLSTILLILYLFFAIIFIAGPILVFANSTQCPENTICIENPLKYEKIEDIIKAITNLLKIIAIPLGGAMIIWGGIQIMIGYSTGEKEKKVMQGKKTIIYAVIGVAIVVGVDILVGLIREFLK